MKIEKLNHSKFKYFLYTLILGVILIFIIGFKTSKASYRTTQSINVANGTINYSPSDLNIVAVYLQSAAGSSTYNSSDDVVPTSGYALNTTKTSCMKGDNPVDATITYDNGVVSFTFPSLSKGIKCNLYFDIKTVSVSDIIANATAGTTSITGVADTNEGLKYVADEMYGGNTYYYRGAVSNNWVKFAGMYWRIIRINGDGSIRMIYSGTAAPTSSTATIMTGTGTQTTTNAFNSTWNDAIYVGWKYTSSNGHGTGTSSTIRTYLVGNDGASGWYSSSGLSSYASYLADGKFCNDRTVSGSYGSNYPGTTGYGTTNTAFAPYRRAFTSSGSWQSTQTVTTGCTNSSDIFTEKVGLITYDEAVLAGGFGGTANTSYYLRTNQRYWTLSPYYFSDRFSARVFCVDSNGNFYDNYVGGEGSVRPVINLKAGTKFKTGTDGTYSKPYELSS